LIYTAGCSHDDTLSRARDAGTAGVADSGAAQRAAAGKSATAGKSAAAGKMGSGTWFPGAGTGNAGIALPSSGVCDAVVRTHNLHVVTPKTKCMKAVGTDYLAATLEQVLECIEGKDTVHLRLTFDPGFVDNTYGTGSIGWPHRRGHTFVKDLTKSDHAEIAATSGDGSAAIRFKLDYISALAGTPSGFGSLGVRGGDGSMLLGDAA
jgi:hypothetical protein